jgi:hypothetical protein
VKNTIIKLSGGLGNQLFQYAFSRAFSERTKSNLILDLSNYNSFLLGETKRKYELDFYNLSATKYKYSIPYLSKAFQLFPILSNIYGLRYYKEKSLSYDTDILKVEANVYFDGYWQSYKYFQDYSILIYNELLPSSDAIISEYLLNVLSKINTTNSVAIHVRRGDYITNKSANDTHGILGEHYYSTALKYINGYIHNPTYFIFSDDIEWCKSFFSQYDGIFIFPSDVSKNLPQEDIMLISHCKHCIIANSSFSWWGAWLGDCKFNFNDRIVIAPKQWFLSDNINDIDSRLPENWIKL